MAEVTQTTGFNGDKPWWEILDRVDRRVIYVFVLLSLAIPIWLKVSLKPAKMQTAIDFYEAIEKLDPKSGKIVFVATDWGPGTSAENEPQTEIFVEHLMRKRIPFALISLYLYAPPFMRELPLRVKERLELEHPGEKWEYATDWVNLGYKPNGTFELQKISGAKDLHDVILTDESGIPIGDIPLMKNIHSLKDVAMLAQFTGLVGVFNVWLQYFQNAEHRPMLVHGCTSITIPEAYIYYESKQIVGLFEGVAGAAWYEWILAEKYPTRSKENVAIPINTGLSYAHLVIIGFMVLGNIGTLLRRLRR